MTAAYGDGGPRWWQPLSDSAVVALAGAATLGVWLGLSPWLVLIGGAVSAGAMSGLAPRRWARVDLALLAALLAAAGALASERAWREVQPDRLGPYVGWATLVTDPRPVSAAVSVVLEVEGERFEAFVYGSARRRLSARHAGERVEIVATRTTLRAATARRAQARHVVGRLQIERVGASAPGSPLATGINRLRERLSSAAERSMDADNAALFTGLVIGDDTAQSRDTVTEFRAAGLSHLTAVSGQNVALVVSSAGVFLRRLPAWWRLGATWALIAWFVILTRAEPSVIRAGVMAGCSAGSFALGRERTPVRILGLAVIVLVLIDPLLVWSVGFWLSVTATLGVTVAAPWIMDRLAGPAWLVAPLSVTLGAQAGVLAPSWLVFGRLPALGVPANLLAVPAAGAVMLIGVPVALIASVLPAAVAGPVLWPAELPTHWVATVAALSARLEPNGVIALAVWVVQAVVLAVLVTARARS